MHGGDRGDGRATRADDVLDHQAAVAGVEQRPFDAALQAVCLGVLAYEEALGLCPTGERGAGDRVGAHREAPDRRRAERGGVRGDELAKCREPVGPQDRPLGVDVVGGARPARQDDLPDHERVLAQQGDQPVAGVHRSDARRTTISTRAPPASAPAISATTRPVPQLSSLPSAIALLIMCTAIHGYSEPVHW